jgi:acetyl-CoA C-acetyltransferase
MARCEWRPSEDFKSVVEVSLMKDAVIVSAVRTPVGKFLGALSELSAVELGSMVVRNAVRRAGIAPDSVDECVIGCVLPAGLGQNPARQAALRGGLADTVSALTINMVCGSGLKAAALAAQAVMTGNAEIVVAGGMESMSNAPYLLPQARKGMRVGDGQVIDSMIKDGLWCAHCDIHMGMTGEAVAEKYGITREMQDAYAVESHKKAANAWNEGRFDAEVLPIPLAAQKRGGEPVEFRRDESVRADANLEALARLKPVFQADGTVTAGNAPGMNDGAAAVVVMSAEKARALGLKPLVTIRAQATSGIAPKWVMMAPVEGVRRVLARAGWTMDEVDLFELNEAFAVQALAVTRELGIGLDRVNVNGGAVAIGHPIGASGARVLVTLIHEMIRRDAKKGVAALCLGGGNSVALAIERS